MKHATRMTTVVLGIVFAASLARAEWSGAAFDRPGLYVGAGPLYAVENFDDDTYDFDGSAGFDLRAGWRFTPHVALEGQLQYFDEFGTTVDVGVREIDLDLEGVTFTTNGKFHLLRGRVQPYALIGLGVSYLEATASLGSRSVSGDDAAFAFRGGGGVDVHLTEHVLLAAEATYLLNTDALSSFDMVPILASVQYRF